MPGHPEQNKTVQAAYRHRGRMNLLWADGHVSLLEGRVPSAVEKPVFWGLVYGQLEGSETVLK
jgi:prepilin-type processing-associated H-X9-DG protein